MTLPWEHSHMIPAIVWKHDRLLFYVIVRILLEPILLPSGLSCKHREVNISKTWRFKSYNLKLVISVIFKARITCCYRKKLSESFLHLAVFFLESWLTVLSMAALPIVKVILIKEFPCLKYLVGKMSIVSSGQENSSI